MFAHLMGIPVEETALSLAPVAVATCGILALKLRARIARRRPRGQQEPALVRRHA